jgi:hypothetical protein
MPDSIVVFPDYGSGDLSIGHVGWVTGLIPGADNTVAGIWVNQADINDEQICKTPSETKYNSVLMFPGRRERRAVVDMALYRRADQLVS